MDANKKRTKVHLSCVAQSLSISWCPFVNFKGQKIGTEQTLGEKIHRALDILFFLN